jgi:hypothetical protein
LTKRYYRAPPKVYGAQLGTQTTTKERDRFLLSLHCSNHG